jgi:hypothetical protein
MHSGRTSLHQINRTSAPLHSSTDAMIVHKFNHSRVGTETEQNLSIPSSTVGKEGNNNLLSYYNETKFSNKEGTSQKTSNTSGQNINNDLSPKQSGAITPFAYAKPGFKKRAATEISIGNLRHLPLCEGTRGLRRGIWSEQAKSQ